MAVYSFNNTFQRIIFIALVISSILLGLIWIKRELQHHQSTLQQVQDNYITLRKSEVKTIVDGLIANIETHKDDIENQLKKSVKERGRTALAIAESIYREEHGRRSEDDVKSLIISTLMSMRFFEGRGHYWIYDTTHTLIAHPYRPLSIGQKDFYYGESQDNSVILEFIQTALASPDGGYVSYSWLKPQRPEFIDNTIDDQKQIAFVQLFEPYNWVIGVAEYVENVTAQTQESMIKHISKIRYGEVGYIFNHSREGVCLNHIEQSNIGKNRWELQDASGLKIVQEVDRVGRQPGGGFLEYYASIDPRTQLPARKISYIRSIDEWGWVLGGGVYLEDIHHQVALLKANMTQQLRANIWTAVSALIFTLILVYFIVRKLFSLFSRELNYLTTTDASGVNVPINLDHFRIKELHQVATELDQYQQQSKQLESYLRKRNSALKEFNYAVSHELKTPLVSIESSLGLIQNSLPQTTDPELTAAFGYARTATRQMNNLLESLLLMFRMDAADSGTDTTACGVLIQDAVDLLTKGNNLEDIKISIAAELPALCGDRYKLVQVWLQLIENAAKYMGDQQYPAIDIGAELIDQEIQFFVRDNGKGIETSYQNKIFGLFDRLDKAVDGTGLGLSLVKRIVEYYGGTIRVESAGAGQGTCFYFTLPDVLTNKDIKDIKK